MTLQDVYLEDSVTSVLDAAYGSIMNSRHQYRLVVDGTDLNYLVEHERHPLMLLGYVNSGRPAGGGQYTARPHPMPANSTMMNAVMDPKIFLPRWAYNEGCLVLCCGV